MRFQLITIVFVLGILGSAEAGFYSGGQILANCESEAATGRSLCAAYLGGIADATGLLAGAGLMAEVMCMPADLSADSLREIFVEYATAKPEELEQVASATVLAAFMSAFPCL